MSRMADQTARDRGDGFDVLRDGCHWDSSGSGRGDGVGPDGPADLGSVCGGVIGVVFGDEVVLPDRPVGREHAFGDERSERAVRLIEITERAAVHQDRQVGRGDLDVLRPAGGGDLGPDRDERRHLTGVRLEELAAVERGVRSGPRARVAHRRFGRAPRAPR